MKFNAMILIAVSSMLLGLITSTESQVKYLKLILVSSPMQLEMRRPTLSRYLRPSLRTPKMSY